MCLQIKITAKTTLATFSFGQKNYSKQLKTIQSETFPSDNYYEKQSIAVIHAHFCFAIVFGRFLRRIFRRISIFMYCHRICDRVQCALR